MKKLKKKNSEKLREKVVIITGASSGIGKQVAKELIKYNAKVVIFARREEKLSKVEEELKRNNISTLKIVGDIKNNENIRKLVDETLKKYGKIDVLLNNAGYGKNIDFLEQSDEDIEEMIETNVIGLIKLTKKVANIMKKQGEGQIINMSSAIAAVPTYRFTTYCITKGAVKILSESIRNELKKSGIKISTVYPALHDTPFCEKANINTKTFKTYRKEDLAKKIVKLMLNKKKELYYPKVYGIVEKLTRLSPQLKVELSNFFSRKLEESRSTEKREVKEMKSQTNVSKTVN